MVQKALKGADKAVDRIGYWYGFSKILYDHWKDVAAAVFLWGSAVSYYAYITWDYVSMIAGRVGPGFYGVVCLFLVFGVVGLSFLIAMASRFVRGKTWLGFERDLEDSASPSQMDRNELADRALTVSHKIASIYGQWQAEWAVAWRNDAEKFSTKSRSITRTSSDKVNTKYIERFSDQCLAEVWSVISASRKFFQIDSSLIWNISHNTTSANDVYEIIMVLGSIEASLRDDQPDLPFYDAHRERRERMLTIQDEALRSQLPLANGGEKSP